ncbi:phage tail protein [Nocardia sp. XZ_19_385]|uniref:phage tail protein n=1 Tax=Nocardia sp. XZ_19_385 TaxID=2769488 RepID=UPI00188FCAE9|nr:phage tail protein [Nocardia sp. XZ_19_385]
MDTESSYLRYLPPVLWEDPATWNSALAPPDFTMGTFLLAFEKLLTGLDDAVRAHPPVAETIAAIPSLFDPWHTPSSFLPWLASWVGLEFPMLQDKQLWDEYQRRRATSEITDIHRLRGLKAGMALALDLFAVTRSRPRVAIDDGNKLLVTAPRPGELVPVTALVSQAPTLNGPISTGSTIQINGLVRPRCVTTGPDGSLFVGDFGAKSQVSALMPCVWRLDPAGRPDVTGTPPLPIPLPRPLAPGSDFTNIVALVVAPPRGGIAETLYILDKSKRLFSLAAPYQGTAVKDVATLSIVLPIAMGIDTNGDLLILDRGNIDGDPSRTKIVIVRPGAAGPFPVRTLPTVVEPLSMHVGADGTILIGDGTAQDGTAPANILRVDRSNAANWVAEPLLPAAASFDNPLVSPSAIVPAEGGGLYVLDAGLRPWASSEFILTVAKPAGVYLVDVAEPRVRRVTEYGNLVFPTAMTAHNGRLVICDPGQLESPQAAPVLSRLAPFRFCVTVHFEHANLPELRGDEDENDNDRTKLINTVAASIRSVVDQLRPAHTVGTLITAG